MRSWIGGTIVTTFFALPDVVTFFKALSATKKLICLDRDERSTTYSTFFVDSHDNANKLVSFYISI